MEPFPFFRRPYYYYDQSRYINQYNVQNRANLREQAQTHNTSNPQEIRRDQANNTNRSQATSRINQKELAQDDFFIEIFGIKLYFDDILIIALIFFLYNEGVKDNFLFISLILLLLS